MSVKFTVIGSALAGLAAFGVGAMMGISQPVPVKVVTIQPAAVEVTVAPTVTPTTATPIATPAPVVSTQAPAPVAAPTPEAPVAVKAAPAPVAQPAGGPQPALGTQLPGETRRYSGGGLVKVDAQGNVVLLPPAAALPPENPATPQTSPPVAP